MNMDNSFAFFAADAIIQSVDGSLASNRTTIAACLTDQCVVNSKQETNNIKRNVEKNNVLKEILSSEKKYLNDLKEIVEGYYDEIRSIVDNKQNLVNDIFANIKEIYDFTR
jgi:hypothetical protein